MTTTTNARMSASTPMPSTAPEMGMTTAPPEPGHEAPDRERLHVDRLTLTPRAAAIRMSWEVARSITPNRVLYTNAQRAAAATAPIRMTKML